MSFIYYTTLYKVCDAYNIMQVELKFYGIQSESKVNVVLDKIEFTFLENNYFQ